MQADMPRNVGSDWDFWREGLDRAFFMKVYQRSAIIGVIASLIFLGFDQKQAALGLFSGLVVGLFSLWTVEVTTKLLFNGGKHAGLKLAIGAFIKLPFSLVGLTAVACNPYSTSLQPETRAEVEYGLQVAVGEAGINFYLNSVGPSTSSFLVDQSLARQTEGLLKERGLTYDLTEGCELVSVVALASWEEPGFLRRIAGTLFNSGITVLQMADAEHAVSCLVGSGDAARAVKALHTEFGLGT